MKKCVIIMNPESGRKKKIKTYEEFYDILRKYGYDTEIILTKSKGDGENIIQALNDDIDLVVSAGGDGTLNEIITGNMKRHKKLVIAPLPLGSTNDVGNMYGLDKPVYENLEILLKGKAKKVDVCYINEKPFIYVACLGEYINMAYATPRELKKKYGRIAYFLYGIQQFHTKIKSYNIRYKVEDITYEGTYSFIFISNSSRIAGQPDVYYDVKLDDNRFEVALANVKDIRELSRLLVLASTVDVKTIPDITYYQTNYFELEFLTPLDTSWCVDGEEYNSNSQKYIFTVNQNMKMLVPKETENILFEG